MPSELTTLPFMENFPPLAVIASRKAAWRPERSKEVPSELTALPFMGNFPPLAVIARP